MTAEQAGGPEKPTDLPKVSWWEALHRAATEFRADNLIDWAAALTYYSVLSIFPGVLVVVSIVGLAGSSATDSLITNVSKLAPGEARDVLVSTITDLQRNRGGAGVAAAIGVLTSIWSASRYVAAFMRASNAIYDIQEGRPVWKTVPIRVAITLVSLIILSVSAVAVVATGTVADRAGTLLGIRHATVIVWDVAKWPALLVVISFLFALLYWASPNARRGFRWITPGGLFAMLLWLLASAGFALYVSLFDSYNKTYGSIAGIIIFLVWLWLSNLALLLGAELNAELERGRHIANGHPAAEEPYVPLRDTKKIRPDQNPGDRPR